MTGQAVHPRISVTTISSWNWSVEQDIAFLVEHDVPAIGVPMTKFGDAKDRDIAAIRVCGIPVFSVSSGGGMSLIESEAATLAALAPAIDTAHALAAPTLYFVTGPTPPQMPTDTAIARLVDCLPGAHAYATEKGVRLAIEHNSVSSRDIGFVHTVAGAAAISRASDLDITLELQNCWYEPDLPRLFRENVDRFCLVQVSDFVVGETLKFNRCVPGDGAMPLEWMLGELLDAGYSGFFEIELLGPAIEKEGYASAILRSVAWLNERLEKWGV